jgi:hypothetical protein
VQAAARPKQRVLDCLEMSKTELDYSMNKKSKASKPTPVEQFGRDHWNTLAFIETLCVDLKGEMSDRSRQRMRTNIGTHPLMGFFPYGTDGLEWKAKYDTRLRDGSQIPNHDDWNCADDCIAAQLLENIGTATNPVYKLTAFGSRLCAALRAFKASGGSFATFDYARYDQVPV